MLTPIEKILFVLAAIVSAWFTIRAALRIQRTIRRGHGEFALVAPARRIWEAVYKTLSQKTVFRSRRAPSLAHALVAWAFMFYLFVNIGDGLEGFVPNFAFLGRGLIGNLYRLAADVLSVGALIGMTALLLRRLLFGRAIFRFAETTTLHSQAAAGIRRDSLIVAGFILLHVGFRFLGASFALAHGAEIRFVVAPAADPWQPFAAAVSGWWPALGLNTAALGVLRHAAWWLALGLILAFFPYFLYSKHIHIFFAPLNFLLKPRRTSLGALTPVNFDDESLSQYGAAKLEHLAWPQVMDAYACIMCNRCQDACPANATGKALSPAALEINKRYFLNAEGGALASGAESSQGLLEFAISAEAVWACTACGACVEICPVGDEPMIDILDIRRSLVLMDNVFPEQLQTAFRGIERQGNPWNLAPESRLEWAQGLEVPTVEANPEFDILYWVGCAPATDARAQKTARDFVKVLRAAGVNFAVLGARERCTGDAARRAGNEYLFSQMAQQNVETLNSAFGERSRRIVTTCPHCLHTLANEYAAFGGDYEAIHHTQLIGELMASGRLKVDAARQTDLAFHDPCYLGRHNGVYDAPRAALQGAGARLRELSRSRNNSFCCGAGGAQMWKEEEAGRERVSANRFREAEAAGTGVLAVGCPFCMIMLTDAAKAAQSNLAVRDVAEIVAESLG